MAEQVKRFYAERRMFNGEWASCVYHDEIPEGHKRKLRNIWEVPPEFKRDLTLGQIREIAPGGKFHTREA